MEEVMPALQSYKESFPSHYILGGISSNSELNDDLTTLWERVASINDIQKKNEIVVTLDFSNVENYSLNAYTIFNRAIYTGKYNYK